MYRIYKIEVHVLDFLFTIFIELSKLSLKLAHKLLNKERVAFEKAYGEKLT